MKQLRKKNHYVPECYLKRWADSDQKVFGFKILVAHPSISNWKKYYTKAITYQKFLYVQLYSEHLSDEVETWLDKNFESPANEALERATSDRKLSKDDWHKLINFLAAQDVRTPARLYEYLYSFQKIVPDILKDVLSDLPEKLDKSHRIQGPISNGNIHPEFFPLRINTNIEPGADTGTLEAKTYIGRSTWLAGIRHLLESTSKHLHNHKWTILKPAQGFYWPTSDNPVVKLNYIDNNKYDLKGGWGKIKGNIIFPIGPEHALFVQIGDRPYLKGTRLSVEKTKEMIKIICENANQMIISKNIDNSILQYRKRIIDPERIRKQKAELDGWHKVNLKMEQEYFPKK